MIQTKAIQFLRDMANPSPSNPPPQPSTIYLRHPPLLSPPPSFPVLPLPPGNSIRIRAGHRGKERRSWLRETVDIIFSIFAERKAGGGPEKTVNYPGRHSLADQHPYPMSSAPLLGTPLPLRVEQANERRAKF